MPDTTDPQPDPLRIPIAHSVRYVVRGLPEVLNQYGSGVLAPSEITLTYRAAPDSQLGRVHAYVAGRLWADGVEIPLLPGALYGQHYDDGLDGWPEWLTEEARLHDPDSAPPAADRAAVLREAAHLAEELRQFEPATGARKSAQVSENVGILRVAAELRRMADEAEYVATPCDFAACEPGGEPCSVHERLMAHAEGDHELCKPDCGPGRVADEAQQAETQGDGPVVAVHAAANLSPAAEEALGALINVAKRQAVCDFGHPHPGHPCGRNVAVPPAAVEARQPDAYEATTGHVITCLAVAGGASDPGCPACNPKFDGPPATPPAVVAEPGKEN